MRKFIYVLLMVLPTFLCAGYLSEGDIQQFYKQGYVLKKQCFAPDLMAKMDMQTAKLLDDLFTEISSSQYPYTKQEQKIYLNGSQVVFRKEKDKPISLLRVVGCNGMEAAFDDYLSSDEMIETFMELLDSDDVEQLISQFHPKLPGDGVTFHKHRDVENRVRFDPKWTDVKGNGSYAIAMIAVDPIGPKNGGIEIDLGSFPPAKAWEENIA